MKKHLVIIGGGFAGFWGAMSAIRQAKELQKETVLQVTLVNPDNYMTIRPRLYEVSLEGLRVELDKYLQPLGIQQILGKAENIDPENQSVSITTHQGVKKINYDYLILATGSILKRVNIPGFENSFNVDNFKNAQKLEDQIVSLAQEDFSQAGSATFVIAGGGFTGLEVATSIREKVQVFQEKYSNHSSPIRVILIEKSEKLAAFYSEDAQSYILETLQTKNIEILTDTYISEIESDQIHLSNGQSIQTQTVIWAGGMTASPLTQYFEGQRDNLNRLEVDQYLKLLNYNNVILAGDVAKAKVDQKGNYALMACQFAMFQGKWAGHNAVNDLFGEALKPYLQENYLTCLDLGQEDALFTKDWERNIVMTGQEAKKIKKEINSYWIYPMPTVEDTLKASYPEVPKT